MATEPAKSGGGVEEEDLSMEEILQSIRSIIAEEEDGSNENVNNDSETMSETESTEVTEAEVAPEVATATEGEAAPEMGSDVLELTDVVGGEEPAVEAVAAEAENAVDVLAQIDEAVDVSDAVEDAIVEPEDIIADVDVEVAVEPAEPTQTPVEIPAAPPSLDEDHLLSNAAALATASAIKKAVQTHKATTPVPHTRSGITIEDLVLESLKPMLKGWLDQNLPGMVERIVEREIRKLVD